MARSHGIIKTTVWDVGGEFRQLTRDAQWAYVMLLSQPQITNCGCLPYLPHKWALLAAGGTREELDHALQELADQRFILIDDTTQEVLVRTFIKHDRIFRQPNLVTNARKELREIESPEIRDYLARRHPWLVDDTIDPKEHEETSQNQTPSGTPSERGLETPSGTPHSRARAHPRDARDADDPSHYPDPLPVRGGRGSEDTHASGANPTGPARSTSDGTAQARDGNRPRRLKSAIADAEIAARHWYGGPPQSFAEKLDAIGREHRVLIPRDERDRLHNLAGVDPIVDDPEPTFDLPPLDADDDPEPIVDAA